MSIFHKRVSFKPVEYPEAEKFKDVMHQSFWTHHHWNYDSDVQDFHTRLSQKEKEVIKRCLLAISQIEVSVKTFWCSVLVQRIPKPEIAQVGAVFGNQEVIHSDFYAKLLEILGYNNEFDNLLEVPEIKGRVSYLTKYLKPEDDSNRAFTKSLTLFSIFTENVSLFSQFYIVKAFNKFKKCLKDVDNGISSSMKEELVHAKFGFWLIEQIKKDHPTWFDEDYYLEIEKAARKAFKAESAIIDWIFSNEDLPFITRDQAKEFVKHRLNESMVEIGGKPIYELNPEITQEFKWFSEELYGMVAVDFFHKKSGYNFGDKSITADDLF